MTEADAAYIRYIAVGQRFNRLTAIEFVGHEATPRRKALWRFRCDCGNKCISRTESVKSGNTQSCGCQKVDSCQKNGHANFVHGQSDTRIYRIWHAMLHRCSNPKNENFEYYGGRGISVCQEWHSIDCFKRWALANGYADDLSIDRYPNQNGNYEPNNCRWATTLEQQRNRRPRRWLKRPPAVVTRGRL